MPRTGDDTVKRGWTGTTMVTPDAWNRPAPEPPGAGRRTRCAYCGLWDTAENLTRPECWQLAVEAGQRRGRLCPACADTHTCPTCWPEGAH